MSKETESKRPLSSAIMRLVGNDGLPSPLYINRHSKWSSYNCEQQRNPPSCIQRNSQLYDSCSSRRSLVEQQEFKNVYEDLEASHIVNRRCVLDTDYISFEFHQEKSFLSRKCIHDQHLVPRSSLGRHRSCEHGMISHQNRKDGLLLKPYNLHSSHIFRRPSKIQVKKKNEKNRRIAVLKPYRGKIPNYARNKNFKAFPVVGYSSIRRRFSKSVYKGAREVAKKVIRNLTNYLDDIVDSGDSKFPRCSSFNLAESSVNRVAKKRLYEVWKMTKKYQYLEMLNEGSTRSKMFALYDRQTRSNQLNSKTSLSMTSKKLGGNNINGVLDGSLGISSRDGWKGETNRTLSSLKSLSPSIGGNSHKRSTYYNKYGEDKYVVHNDPKGYCKALKGNPNHKEKLSSGGKEFWSRKPILHRHKITHKMDPVSEANFEMQMEANIKNGFKLYTIRDDDKSTAHGQEDFNQKLCTGSSPGDELDSSESSKDAGDPSPISVLEIPATKDVPTRFVSSSEKVGAELHALQTQVELPIDEQLEHPSPNCNLTIDDRETYYALDVLTDSGLQESCFDMFKIKWHAPDSPLDPKLFNNLEMAYETTGSISERLLLFDRINFSIFDIFKEHVNLFPWVMTKFSVPSSTEHEEWIRVVFEKLINQDEQGGAELSERVLDEVSQWSDFREEIDAIGNEIEEFLIDYLILEVMWDDIS